MPNVVDTPAVQQLVAAGAQLLEVLPPSAYAKEHLPGAVNIPLPELTPHAAERLDRARPVVVYCYDTECDLSARGAALLERYGFAEVYDYRASKTAWLGMDLEFEGSVTHDRRAGGRCRPAATAAPDAPLEALPPPGPGGIVVVVDGGLVLGVVRPEAAVTRTTVLDVLQPGPPTVRPSITIDELAQSMEKDRQHHVLVTTLDGMLLGVVCREDLHARD